jgi:ankyrin repeat protein
MTVTARWGVCGALVLVAVGRLGAAPTTSSLVDAVRNGDTTAVRTLLQRFADANAATPDGTTVLHWAVHRDNIEVVDLLLRAGASVEAINRYGITPLWLAAENGNAAIISRLLKVGADANRALPGGETILMTAAQNGAEEAVQLLVAAGANANARDGRGQTALMWAASKNNSAAIRVLVAAGADVNARTGPAGAKQRPGASQQEEALQALTTQNSFGGGRSLFQDPAPTGFTPLLFAVRAGSVEAVKVLLDAGADVNDTLSDGESALIVAVANAHWQLADLLLDRGADPNAARAGWNALHQAVRTRRPHIGFGTPGPIPTGTLDSINVIKKMLSKNAQVDARMSINGMKDGQRNALIRTGATAFFLAAKNTDTEVMRLLLASGANAVFSNAEGTTPLMVAAGLHLWNPGEDGGSLAGQEDEVLAAVKLCVDNGNEVNAVDGEGWTALHGAAFRGVEAIVEYLVEKGAKLDAKNNAGWTPLAIANGLSYSDFYKNQPQVAAVFVRLMQARGLPTEGHEVDPKVCFECLQTHAEAQNEFRKRERKAAAEFAKQVHSQQSQ